MKWFKHLSSAYTDLAIRQVIEEFGVEGYGLYWLCCELVAQQGKHFCLKKDQNWLKILELLSKTPEKKLIEILQKFSELNLINKTAYKNGDIYIQKMKKYADEYTDKVGRKSGQGRDCVGLDKIRRDKIRKEESDFSFKNKKRPTYNNMEMRKKQGKWYCIAKDGEWLEFAGKEEEIQWL